MLNLLVAQTQTLVLALICRLKVQLEAPLALPFQIADNSGPFSVRWKGDLFILGTIAELLQLLYCLLTWIADFLLNLYPQGTVPPWVQAPEDVAAGVFFGGIDAHIVDGKSGIGPSDWGFFGGGGGR